MGIIHFILTEEGDATSRTGQYAFNKELLRYISQLSVGLSTTIIQLYFQTQGELYTHDVINIQVLSPYKTVVIQKLIEDLCKSGGTTIRDNTNSHVVEKGVYKHILDITYTASA